MKVYIGADHGGYRLKEELKVFLTAEGYEVEDMGAHSLDQQDDYPDFIFPVAQKVASQPGSRGIVLGRSGIGEAVAANKVKGIRAALCLTPEMAKKAREHGDANVLSLGADFIDVAQAEKMVLAFLKTPFSDEERHKRRIEKIKEYESAHNKQT